MADYIYIMTCGLLSTLCEYDLTGQLITTWDLVDTRLYAGKKISMVREQVATANVANGSIALYTLDGDVC